MQFESHVMLESDSIPLGKNFKLARMREGGDQWYVYERPAYLADMDSRLRGNDAAAVNFPAAYELQLPDLVPYQSNLVTLRTESVTPVQE
jgi:hypothetical protein